MGKAEQNRLSRDIVGFRLNEAMSSCMSGPNCISYEVADMRDILRYTNFVPYVNIYSRMAYIEKVFEDEIWRSHGLKTKDLK